MNKSLKEKLYNECRIEEVDENTYCLYYEYAFQTSNSYKETCKWIWSNDLNKLVNCYKEVIVCEIIVNALKADNILDLSTIEVLKLYSNNSNKLIFDELILLLENNIMDFNLLNDYLNQVAKCINKLCFHYSINFCKGSNDAIDIVIDHFGGDVPHFDTIKEYLLDDSYEC